MPRPNALNFVVDNGLFLRDLLSAHVTHEISDLASHEVISNSIYLLGPAQISSNTKKFRDMCQDSSLVMVMWHTTEGSQTLMSHMHNWGIMDLAESQKFSIITCGDLDNRFHSLTFDHFLTHILDYQENLDQIKNNQEIFTRTNKPYRFLFLNGRARPHRKYIKKRLQQLGLLDKSLWTYLDDREISLQEFSFEAEEYEILSALDQIQLLPQEYEVTDFDVAKVKHLKNQFIMDVLFNNTWGAAYLKLAPYRDTYFSLVTETVFNHPYGSFRTEKISKPLAIGHPWIVATTPYFYRDLRNLGFKTFSSLINEDFDSIEHDQSRLDRIIAVVRDLCEQDLDGFLREAEPICKYNQQHLLEFAPQWRRDFSEAFFNFISAKCKI